MTQFIKGQKVFFVTYTGKQVEIHTVTIVSCGAKLAKVEEICFKFSMTGMNPPRLFATLEQALSSANLISERQNSKVVVI